MSNYSDKLKDPRWQKKRLELLQAANWTCQMFPGCCQNDDAYKRGTKPTLHVHHLVYIPKTDPWDYENWAYEVLCDKCHEFWQDRLVEAHIAIAKSKSLMALCCSFNRWPDKVKQLVEESVDSLGKLVFAVRVLTERDLENRASRKSKES